MTGCRLDVTKRRGPVSGGYTVESEETGLADDRHVAPRARRSRREEEPGRRSGSGHRGVPRPPSPALHGRLRAARLGRRCRRRPAGDLAAVVGRRSRQCARWARMGAHTWSGSPPARRSAGCVRLAVARSRTSGPGCPSRCSPRPMWPRTSNWPTVSRWRCCWCWCWNAHADRAGGVPAARGVRAGGTTRSRKPLTRVRLRFVRSRTGRGHTSLRPAARGRFCGRDPRCARRVPTGDRNGRSAGPGRHPRARRCPPK